MSEDFDREVSRRGVLSALGSGVLALVAGCQSKGGTSTATTTGESTTSTSTTTSTMGPTRFETTGLRIPLYDEGASMTIDRLFVGDKLGKEPASDGHKWVLAPVYVDADQTEDLDVQLPSLGRFRVAGYLGDEPATQPLGYIREGRDEYRPTYALGDYSFRHYPVDGVPDGVNDPETVVPPSFGIAFETPENAGYELQILSDSGMPIISMTAQPPRGETDAE